MALAVIVAGGGSSEWESAEPPREYTGQLAEGWRSGDFRKAQLPGGNADTSSWWKQQDRFDSDPQPDYTALAALDARDHPGVTVPMESLVVAAATGRVRALAVLPALAVLAIGVAFQWEGTQHTGEVDGLPAQLDAVGYVGVNDGRSRDGGTLPELWGTTLSAVIEAVAFQWEGTQPQRGLASATTSSLRADQAPIGEIGRNSKVPPEDVQNIQTDHFADAGNMVAALAALDARDHPGVTVSLESIVVAAATGRVRALGGSLTEAEMDALLEVAGWPVEWRAEAKQIAWCESKWSPYAVGDGGNSLGLWQMWTGWFGPAGEDIEGWADPLVSARVALYVRQVRGRWGGGGGWSCAGLNGIE